VAGRGFGLHSVDKGNDLGDAFGLRKFEILEGNTVGSFKSEALRLVGHNPRKGFLAE
jgi:hypothetical protein